MEEETQSEELEITEADVKIGSPREVLFTDMRDRTTKHIDAVKKELEVQTEVLKMCEQVIAEEKEKI